MKATTKQTISFYLKHLKKHKLLAVLSFAGVFVGVLANSVIPIILKLIVDTMTAGVEMVQLSEVLFFLIPLSAIYLLNMLAWRVTDYSMSILEPKVMASIANECFEKIHKHSYNFFNNEFVGSLVKRVNRMVRSFENFFDIITFEILSIAIRLLAAVAILFWVSPIFGVTIFVWAIIYIGFNYLLSIYKLKKYDVPRAATESKFTAHLADTISNNVNIKLFSTRKYEEKAFGRVVSDWKRKHTDSWVFSAHIDTVQNLLMVILEVFMLYVVIRMWNAGSITIGDFILIQTYLVETFIFVWGFGRNLRRLYVSFADAEEMTEILNTPIEIKNVSGAKDLVVRRGKVDFKNVDFSYDKAEGVIRGLNLTVKPGEKLALIGPSGGGKTTIVKLLLRLFDIEGGEILVDGQNISDVTQDSIRAQITMVPQDPILFHRSLMENIRYGQLEASDEEVITAAKMAHCHEFISQFPKGYDTLVGERGVKLSGGERQRIAIARAILSNAQILILDEATSNLDVHSEQLIQDALTHLIKNKTTIVIAHRLSTVVNMDRIIVVEDGKVVEEGGHRELMKNEKGLYKSLWDLYSEVPQSL